MGSGMGGGEEMGGMGGGGMPPASGMDGMAPPPQGGGNDRLMMALAQDPSFRGELARLMQGAQQGPPAAQRQAMGGPMQLRGPNEMFGPAGQATMAAQQQAMRRGPPDPTLGTERRTYRG